MFEENYAKSKRAERVRKNKAKTKNLNSVSCFDEKLNAYVYKGEKNWKYMYSRSNKMHRAKQLGFEYPRRSTRQMLDDLER